VQVRCPSALVRRGTMREKTESEEGFTLVETLISLTILATLVILVVGAMLTLVVSSTLNRNQGAVASVIKRAAEDIRAASYVTCDAFGGGAPYAFASFPATAAEVPENQASDERQGVVVELPALTRITTIDGNTDLWTRAGGRRPGCVGQENATQLVEIATASADGKVTSKLFVAKMKPEVPA